MTERIPPAPRIYRSLNELDGSGIRRAVTIGNFDGVHAGHRRIFRRVAALARERGWRAAAMIFEPHPAKVVAPERAPRLLATPDERCVLMAEEGIEEVLILPFKPEIAALSPEEFARDILVAKLGAAAVIVGANFHFGHRQAGDTRRLAELGRVCGFLTEVVPRSCFARACHQQQPNPAPGGGRQRWRWRHACSSGPTGSRAALFRGTGSARPRPYRR